MHQAENSIEVLRQTLKSYRKMIDGIVSQLSDEALTQRPSPQFNSVAILLRHLGGNLVSRWTDFLTTDGEKESRDRDLEFADWQGSREELMEYFARGWKALETALSQIDEADLGTQIRIRGEAHTLLQALIRSVTHVTYHVGQMALISRMVHQGEWNWLTIAPNDSGEFNRSTWGTSKSRAVFDTNSDQSDS